MPWLAMGGADKFNLDATRQLHGQGWEVSVATTLGRNNTWVPQFTAATPDVFVLDHFIRLVDYPRFLRYLIESRGFDVVMLSNSELGYGLLPYLRHHCSGVTFVDYCHMEEEEWKNGGHPRAAVEHQELVDLNIVSSNHLKQWMVTRGADEQRIEVCYTNVDTEYWQPDSEQRSAVRTELGVPPDAAVILYAGRLTDQKQPRVFAETMLELRRRQQIFVALVAGDGPHRRWLQQFVRTHRLKTVIRVLGGVPNARMKALLSASDVFFLPSQQEGISLAIYEAMASSVVPVGADVGGQRELVTPECGVLIRRSDEATESADYANALEQLLRDPARRRLMGALARERVRHCFPLPLMGRRILEVFARADELRRVDPRPTISPGVAHLTAAQTVEYTRLAELTETLWRERNALLGHVNPSAPTLGALLQANSLSWLRRLAGRTGPAAWYILKPIYRWGMRRNYHWMQEFRDRVKDRLFLRSEDHSVESDQGAGR